MTELDASHYSPEQFYNAARKGRFVAKLCTRVIMPTAVAVTGYEQFIGGNALIQSISASLAVASVLTGVFDNSLANLAEMRGIELENQAPIASETA